MKNLAVRIIGLGGVGSALCEPICRFIHYMKDVGTREVTLVDGDSYEVKNQERQTFYEMGNKASVKCLELADAFPDISFEDIGHFVNGDNVHRIIYEGDIVFVCVDNHHTRKLISDYTKTLRNVLVISGGNEYEDGNVQIYLRKGGIDITPTLTDYHPEIDSPEDRSPEDMSCEELASSDPQLLFTNLTAATIMCQAFYNVAVREIEDPSRVAEIYFDITTMNVLSKLRKPKHTNDNMEESNVTT